ncbi:hypothetical protein DH2020_011560 [Rehmannia glutinosa]|uniref:ENTH domain-containing protein n=1 Tax=Rehmannia glutinosa TaxID=99300 RepID=A0ABR0XDT1_REHGL
MASKLKKAIGAVKDQTSISLAKVSNNTSTNLEVAVLKATTHDAVPIDDKYVNEILHLVSSNKIHAAACARAIGKRIGRTRNWVVALKSLMLVLRIFQDGDPYFPREVLHAMKRGDKILNLSSFRDDSNSSPWDFTSFIRTFALYLDLTSRVLSDQESCSVDTRLNDQLRFTTGARAGRVKANDPVRDMKPAMLLDKMSSWQRLLDRAIATRPTGAAKTNHLVHISLYAIVQESFDLYKDISDGLTLVLDSFFHLQYQNCVVAFQTCIKAVKQFEELSAFYSLCKSLGVGRSSEYPSVQAISEELIETLQEFLKDQSSFPSNAKPVTNRLMIGPAPPPNVRSRSSRHDSYGGQSSDFSPTTDGLSDRTWTGPAISIDLGVPASQRDDAFGVNDTGSSRSLPVSSSIVDLMSLDDWTEQDEIDEQDHQQDQTEKGNLESSDSRNWEIVLAETISSPLSDNNTNTFNAFTEKPPAAEDNHSTAINGWDLVLFEAAPPQQPTPNVPLPSNNHYNPFLLDPIELPEVSNQQSVISVPTFQATPTFSAQNHYNTPFPVQNEDDPFACGAEFSGEQMLSSPTDQQNLLHEQQLWLQNQNKIIAKHWS